MAGSIDAYTEEIFNFLRTVSIKFEPFAYLMGQSYMEQHGLTDPHGEWNPYYLNLSGEYAPNDTRMSVYSVEEERYVAFDKNLRVNYPKTAAIYKIPNQEYRTLEERYPQNIGLIQAIAYPGVTIKQALEAPNLSLLNCDASLLHINERESLVSCLKEFLDMVRARWWIEEYCYENMYAVTFWSMLWQHLPTLLLSQRFKNIRTPYVHPFHIWEYLKSKGLGDYRDILTNNQALWLYRNIDYIQKNKGKNSNLVLLAQNLLGEVFVSLLQKDMRQVIGDNWDECRTTPIFISENVVTGEEVKQETFPILNQKLVASGFEHTATVDYEERVSKKLSDHGFNILPTKYLEFKKNPINTSNAKFMTMFFLDNFIWRMTNKASGFSCLLSDTQTNSHIPMTMEDTLLLMHYAWFRSLGETPVKIPQKYQLHVPLVITKPQLEDLTASMYLHSTEYPVRTLVDEIGMLNALPFEEKPFLKQSDYMEFLVDQFEVFHRFMLELDQSSDHLYHEAMRVFFHDILRPGWVDLHLTTETSFDAWIASRPWIQELVDNYNHFPDQKSAYAKLATTCVSTLFPLDKETRERFLGNAAMVEKLYNSIRDLFIQLGSYNVTYLENEREQREYLKILDPNFHLFKETSVICNYAGLFNKVITDPVIKYSLSHDLGDKEFKIDAQLGIRDMTEQSHHKFHINFNRTQEQTWKNKRSLPVEKEIRQTGVVYDVAQNIHIHTTTAHRKG